VYVSKDSEGNSYSTVSPQYSFQFGEVDKILTIMPFNEGLMDEDIAPKEMTALDAEMKHDAKVEAKAS